MRCESVCCHCTAHEQHACPRAREPHKKKERDTGSRRGTTNNHAQEMACQEGKGRTAKLRCTFRNSGMNHRGRAWRVDMVHSTMILVYRHARMANWV